MKKKQLKEKLRNAIYQGANDDGFVLPCTGEYPDGG